MDPLTGITMYPLIAIICFVISFQFFKLIFPLLSGTYTNSRTIPAAITFATVHVFGLSCTVPIALGFTVLASLQFAYDSKNLIVGLATFAFGVAALFLLTYVSSLIQTILVAKGFGTSIELSGNSMLFTAIRRMVLKEAVISTVAFIPSAILIMFISEQRWL